MIATADTLDKLWDTVSEEQQQSLNRDAFNDIAKVYFDFITAHESGSPTHWVCDAAPGHGKTTVLQYVLQALAQGREPTPALIVFNNTDTMDDFFRIMRSFGDRIGLIDLIQYVDKDNVKAVQETLQRHLYVCITQQRLRDLGLGLGDWREFGLYQPHYGHIDSFDPKPVYKPRAIIIDEMPILFDECILDIGSENNAVAWFDDIADHIQMGERDRRLCRNIIMNSIVSQFLMNNTSVTTALKTFLQGSTIWERFSEVYSGLKVTADGISLESLRYKRWFDKLLHNDSVGCIDRDNGGEVILCSERIDYRTLGNVLILDGTSDVTQTLYRGYAKKHVPNRHDYAQRLHVHWRELKTSSTARKKDSKGVQQAIANDFTALRHSGINPFPLVAKNDIEEYMENGVISHEHAVLYEGRDGSKTDSKSLDSKITKKERLALNLFNTTGKNDLRDYNALALTSLPIRHPQYYKLKAIGVFGTGRNISLSANTEDGWFEDLYVEWLFVELVMADLLQIIHRSNLRDINKSTRIDLFLYHDRENWITQLKEQLNLMNDNVSRTKLSNDSNYGFENKCREWAEEALSFLKVRDDPFNEKQFQPSDIGGRSFKDWLNDNWKKPERQVSVIRIFGELGLEIVESEKKYKYLKLKYD